MIELRWAQPEINVNDSAPKPRLQYRILVDSFGGTITSHTGVAPYTMPRKEWSPWMDVPTVFVPPAALETHLT